MTQTRSSRGILLLLVLVMAGSAFALGIGVMGLLDDDEPRTIRAVRVTDDGLAVEAPAPVVAVEESGRDSRFTLLDEVYTILDQEFVEPERVDLVDIRTAAINGAIASLNDPHSVYIDEETFRLSSESISGQFEGIGATVNQQGDEILISGTFRDSPAEAAGIRSGDVILAVNGESTEGWSLQLTVARIRGERGTSVEVTVRHRNDVEETITIVRERIVVPSVLSVEIEDREGQPVEDIGYLIITQYTERTRTELLPFLDSVREAGLSQLIVDLRGNPGGLLTATVETTAEFLDGGLVLIEVARDGSTQDFTADSGGAAIDLEIVILVDGGSASGAEVMAEALRAHGRGVVIGEQTIGKGTVNLPRRLSDGSVLYVSIARWLGPDGNIIEGIGVIPDIIVEPSDEDFAERRDVQLFAAVEYLRDRQNATSALPD